MFYFFKFNYTCKYMYIYIRAFQDFLNIVIGLLLVATITRSGEKCRTGAHECGCGIFFTKIFYKTFEKSGLEKFLIFFWIAPSPPKNISGYGLVIYYYIRYLENSRASLKLVL